MIPIVEPIQEVNAFTEKEKCKSGVLTTRDRKGHALPIVGVTFFELLHDPNFDTASLAILLNGSDNLDGNALIGLNIDRFDNFAKGPLTKQANSTV